MLARTNERVLICIYKFLINFKFCFAHFTRYKFLLPIIFVFFFVYLSFLFFSYFLVVFFVDIIHIYIVAFKFDLILIKLFILILLHENT